MKNRAFSLPEVLISASLLLILLGISSMVCVSYLRVYRQYTDKSVRLRLEAKSLESLSAALRSVEAIYSPDQRTRQAGFMLSAGKLDFVDLLGRQNQLNQTRSTVCLVVDGQPALTIKNVEHLYFREVGSGRERRLELQLKQEDLNNPLDTVISWRPTRELKR